MSKFLVLYKSEQAIEGLSVSEMFATTPPEQMQKGMEMWGQWYGAHQAAIVDMGAPLDHAVAVHSGEVLKTRSAITGYTIVEAENGESAAHIVSDHPHLLMPGASIEVLECLHMGGM